MPESQLSILSPLSTEDRIPADHPIGRIRVVVDEVLARMDGQFDAMYAASGQRSVPLETLLKVTALMEMDSIRSERAFCERRTVTFCSSGRRTAGVSPHSACWFTTSPMCSSLRS